MDYRPHTPSVVSGWSVLCSLRGEPVMAYTRVDHQLADRARYVYRYGSEPHPEADIQKATVLWGWKALAWAVGALATVTILVQTLRIGW